MNGWHRLWLLATVIYAIVVAVVASNVVSSIRPGASASNLAYMSDATLLALSKSGDVFENRDVGGIEVPVPANLEEAEKEKVAADIHRAILKDAAAERLKVIWIAFALWIGPSLLCLGLGHSIAWVVRGFRMKGLPQQPTPEG